MAVIHAHPKGWSDITPCCGHHLRELGEGVLTTTDPEVVTCGSGHVVVTDPTEQPDK